jgi:tripartite-type tricarboxylate transporter receptor subunit TctC
MNARGLVAVAAALLVCTPVAQAQTYPAKPVRVTVAFAAGGIADGVGRMVSQKLADRFGQPFVVENRGGAGGNVAAKQVMAAAPDGYTLLVTTAAISINASLHKDAGFDPLADFVPVAITASTPGLIVVHPSVTAANLKEYLQAMKGKRLTYATAGVGSSSHLAGEYLFKTLAGMDATHIPYQGGAPAVTAALSQQVDALSISMPTPLPHVKQGKLKALAVASLTRVAVLPDVPTVAESGFPEFEERSWVAFFAPAKTSPEIVAQLNGAINDALRQPDVRDRLNALGFEPHGGSSQEFSTYLRKEVDKWARIVKATGVTAN